MAFKTVEQYNNERYGGFFLLKNDGDYADVIFLYRDLKDVLIADTHYIKSSEYSGYVHCLGHNCPACAKDIRVQNKLFIPLYNITEQEIQFFDRSTRFELQLQDEVFKNYPNPSEVVFRITRHGAAGDRDTRYSIVGTARNNIMSYDDILKSKGVSLPDYYSIICKEYTRDELYNILNTSVSESDLPDYQVSPRVAPAVSEPPSALPDFPSGTSIPESKEFTKISDLLDSDDGLNELDIEDDVSF